MGIDMFYFRPKAPDQPVTVSVSGFGNVRSSDHFSLPVFGIGFDVVRLRLPLLRSEEFPHGQPQPHLTAGPALVLTLGKSPRGFQPPGQEHGDTALGVKAEEASRS